MSHNSNIFDITLASNDSLFIQSDLLDSCLMNNFFLKPRHLGYYETLDAYLNLPVWIPLMQAEGDAFSLLAGEVKSRLPSGPSLTLRRSFLITSGQRWGSQVPSAPHTGDLLAEVPHSCFLHDRHQHCRGRELTDSVCGQKTRLSTQKSLPDPTPGEKLGHIAVAW